MRKRPYDFLDEHIRGIYIPEQTIGRGSGCRQAFVKITGRSYTSRTVVASLSYIGQESDGVGKDTRVLDENGKEIKTADFEKAVKEWGFNPEIDKRNENKTKGQRKTRLTTQFVVSFPKSCYLSVRQRRDGDRPIKKTLLERQVPKWYEKNKDIVLRDKGPRPIPFLQRLPELERKPEALDVWTRGFEDGNKAAVLFLEMYAENPRTAFWYANNKPDVFGKRSASNAPTEPLNSQNFHLTSKDRKSVLKSRDEIAACMTSPLAYPRIDIEAAWRKVYNLTIERKQTRRTKEREIER